MADKITKLNDICSPIRRSLGMRLAASTHVCRYHRCPARKYYTNNLIAPPGMCIDLFHSTYPYCLSLLYGGAHTGNIIVDCPNPESNVSVRLTKVTTKTRYIRELAVRILKKFGINIELPAQTIVMKILEDINDSCLYDYKKGRAFLFNIWLGREVCPATFDAIYPFVHNILRGGRIPWHSESGIGGKVTCPDPKSNITIEITPLDKR